MKALSALPPFLRKVVDSVDCVIVAVLVKQADEAGTTAVAAAAAAAAVAAAAAAASASAAAAAAGEAVAAAGRHGIQDSSFNNCFFTRNGSPLQCLVKVPKSCFSVFAVGRGTIVSDGGDGDRNLGKSLEGLLGRP